MRVRPFDTSDSIPVSVLLATAFDDGFETRLVSQLRAAGDMAIELVAEDAGRVIGYVGFCWLKSPPGWLSLSPVVVSLQRQGQGVGAALIREGLDRARLAGAKAVTVLGNPDYYTRFGFTRKAAENLIVPYDKAYFMLYPIAAQTAGAAHAVSYPPAFSGV